MGQGKGQLIFGESILNYRANIIIITDSKLLQATTGMVGDGFGQGKLIFRKQSIKLQANIIVITDGGQHQVSQAGGEHDLFTTGKYQHDT